MITVCFYHFSIELFIFKADGKSIVLSDGDKTYPATTVNIVPSQSTITTITALQVIDDDFLGTGSYMGVFGTDDAGTPFYGLGSLSSSPVFGDDEKTGIRVCLLESTKTFQSWLS